MPTKIESPKIIKAEGNKPKSIEEYIGRVNSKTDEVSIARMKSPPGWTEPEYEKLVNYGVINNPSCHL